jgi:murein DD-endopeptidase MepM/ murein hydrolase activator NlpD
MLKGFQQRRFAWALLLTLLIVCIAFWSSQHVPSRLISNNDNSKQEILPSKTLKFLKGENLFTLLVRAEIPTLDINQILNSAKGQLNFSALKTNQKIDFFSNQETAVNKVQLHVSDTDSWIWEKNIASNTWTFKEHKENSEFRLMSYTGIVESSLWGSATEAQMDPSLIAELTEIFAWQIDFAREVQKGDKWRITVEQKMVRGRPSSWGRILAAEYDNAGNKNTALLFVKDGKDIGYFTPEGKSLKKIFLKSPIKYSRISSRFTHRRFHPLLKTFRPHLGVDYAAPFGTEVRAVGDGSVDIAGWNGGAGRMVRIRHNSTYATQYKHLSRIPASVRVNGRVKQGQVIGYVGSSGLSTGPHLHFEFWENNRYVDPLGKNFPVAEPVSQNLIADFQRKAQILLESLPVWLDDPALGKNHFEISQNLSQRIYQEALN